MIQTAEFNQQNYFQKCCFVGVGMCACGYTLQQNNNRTIENWNKIFFEKKNYFGKKKFQKKFFFQKISNVRSIWVWSMEQWNNRKNKFSKNNFFFEKNFFEKKKCFQKFYKVRPIWVRPMEQWNRSAMSRMPIIRSSLSGNALVFFSKKNLYSSIVPLFHGAHPDTPYLRKILTKQFFFNKFFFNKSFFFLKKMFFYCSIVPWTTPK